MARRIYEITRNSVGDPWENLANAVIKTAAEDYRRGKKRLRDHPSDGHAGYTVQEVVAFLRSQYFQQVTQTDGECILSRLQEEGV